jgi:hypothetical protein
MWMVVVVIAALTIMAAIRAATSGVRGFLGGLRGDFDKIYYVDMHGTTAGPYTILDLAQLYRERIVTEETLFATKGAQEWQPISVLLPKFAEHALSK